MMKYRVLLFALLLLCACSQRSMPTAATRSDVPKVETEQTEPTDSKGCKDSKVSMDNMESGGEEAKPLSLSRLTLGQALRSCIRQVETVTVTGLSDEETVYSTADDVLAQGFYDALQSHNGDSVSFQYITDYQDYHVHFTTTLGIDQEYQLSIHLNQDDAVWVQSGEESWFLPLRESNWLRERLNGLA